MRRHKEILFAVGALAFIVVVLALGFYRLGSPGHQRAITADAHRVDDLHTIAANIEAWQKCHLQAALADLKLGQLMDRNDPVTHVPYEYHFKSGTAYELCATFATASTESTDSDNPWGKCSAFWRHTKGHYCYQLDSSETPECSGQLWH
ncbi:MAG: hypothetical protein ABSG25_10110 [Bryobacteraceae bacterium]